MDWSNNASIDLQYQFTIIYYEYYECLSYRDTIIYQTYSYIHQYSKVISIMNNIIVIDDRYHNKLLKHAISHIILQWILSYKSTHKSPICIPHKMSIFYILYKFCTIDNNSSYINHMIQSNRWLWRDYWLHSLLQT